MPGLAKVVLGFITGSAAAEQWQAKVVGESANFASESDIDERIQRHSEQALADTVRSFQPEATRWRWVDIELSQKNSFVTRLVVL